MTDTAFNRLYICLKSFQDGSENTSVLAKVTDTAFNKLYVCLKSFQDGSENTTVLAKVTDKAFDRLYTSHSGWKQESICTGKSPSHSIPDYTSSHFRVKAGKIKWSTQNHIGLMLYK